MPIATGDDTRILQHMERSKPANVLNLNQVSDSTSGHSCGYCNNPTGSVTWGFVSQKLSADVYEELINRGWRRCGTYYYKPNMDRSCCKSYTIRMDVNQYKIKKQQRKTVKNLLELVKQKKPRPPKQKKDSKPTEAPPSKPAEKHNSSVEKGLKVKMELEIKPQIELSLTNILGVLTDRLATNKEALLQLIKLKELAQFNFEVKDGIRIFASKAGGPKGDYYSNYAMLLFGKNKHGLEKTTMHEFCQQVGAHLVQQLRLISHEYDYRLDHSGYLIFVSRTPPVKLDNTEEYQVIPAPSSKDGGSEPRLKKKATSEQFVALECTPKKQTEDLKVIEQEDSTWPELFISDSKIVFGRLEVDIVPVEESPEAFALYSKYSKNIHGKLEKSMSSYTGFLCEDALEVEREQRLLEKSINYNCTWDQKGEHLKPIEIKGTIVKKLGCYHMKYSLDGRLIGVGVVDFMPQGMSSVYYFYDHTFKEHRLGVFSSLLEIEYIKYLSKVFPQFRYYYMGYYIQNCQKMNYKGKQYKYSADYEPCQLLCPATFTYVPVDKQLRQKIDAIMAGKVVSARLTDPTVPINPDMVITGDVGVFVDKNLKLFYRQRPITLKDLDKRFFVPILTTLKSHVQVIGKNLFLRFKYEV